MDNIENLITKYNEYSSEDYKKFFIRMCEHVNTTENWNLSKFLSEIMTSKKSKNIPFIARKYIIDYIVDNDIDILYIDIIELSVYLDKSMCEELLNHMLEKFIDSNSINNNYILIIIYLLNFIGKEDCPQHYIAINKEFIKTIHDKYGNHHLDANIHNFEEVMRYCFTFCNYLTNIEKEKFFKKLQAKTRHKYIEEALEKINFSEDQKQRLQSLLLLDELAV